MVLGYRRYHHLAIAYTGIAFLTAIAYWVRSVRFSEFSDAMNLKLTLVSMLVTAGLWESLRFIDRFLDRKLPFESGIARRVAVQLLAGSVVGLLIRFSIYSFGESSLPFKLDSMFVAATWAVYTFLPAAINLGLFTAHFIERWKQSVTLASRLEREKAQVQFDNLRNQLNPHFLFNALTSLNSLIYEDQVLASQFLQQLSRVYRYALQNSDKSMVSLETEMEFIQHYVSLLLTRFRGALHVEFSIPDESRSRSIAPVTLQILIENAIKHNVVDKARPLWITVKVQGDHLVVANNLQEKRNIDASNRQGLENLRKLYEFFSDKPLTFERMENQFIVKVPLI